MLDRISFLRHRLLVLPCLPITPVDVFPFAAKSNRIFRTSLTYIYFEMSQFAEMLRINK